MGSRVDIFTIENQKCTVGFSHGGATDLWHWIHKLIEPKYRKDFGNHPNPMADCYAEAACIINLDNKTILWCSDHSETIDGFECKAENIEGWNISEVSCYCSIYFELKRTKLWTFEIEYNISACKFDSPYNE